MKLAAFGGTGRTGRHVVEQALAAGHQVRALARDPARLGLSHDRLEPFVGDVTDASRVAEVCHGCDAVLSALGPTAGRKDICSTAAKNVIAAGVKRYVSISGAGIDVNGDEKDLFGKLVSFMVRTVTPAVFEDKVREHQLLASSSVGWTLVRPPRLVDRPARGGARSSLVRAPGSSIGRADLAAFVLAAAADDALIGKAPFVAG